MILRFALLPILFILLLVELAGGILRAPYLGWNEIRLCRSMALLRGFPLYPGQHTLGPIIGTLHTPLSHLFYTAAAIVPNPTAAILAGSLMSLLAVFVPVAWVIFRAAPPSGHRPMFAALCFLFSAFLIIQSPGTYHVLFFVHADALAVGLATLGCGFLCRLGELKTRDLWLAGFACAASLAAKQTMAPVVVAVAAYLLVACNWRAAMHFLGAAAVGGSLLLAAMLSFWPARDVLFNIWSLASSRPAKNAAVSVLVESYRSFRLDSLPALLPLLFISVSWWLGSRRRQPVRQFLVENPWSLFALCGVCILPVAIKAMVTIGSSVNHFGVVLYFFIAAAALAIQQHLADQSNPALRLNALLFLASGILVGLAPGLGLTLSSGLANVRRNPFEVAIAYNRKHPGRAYFPWNPAVGLLAGNHLYHLDPALFDREQVGYALSDEQLRSGLPPHFDIVAVPPGEILQSNALLNLTARYHSIIEPELPGWMVLAK